MICTKQGASITATHHYSACMLWLEEHPDSLYTTPSLLCVCVCGSVCMYVCWVCMCVVGGRCACKLFKPSKVVRCSLNYIRDSWQWLCHTRGAHTEIQMYNHYRTLWYLLEREREREYTGENFNFYLLHSVCSCVAPVCVCGGIGSGQGLGCGFNGRQRHRQLQYYHLLYNTSLWLSPWPEALALCSPFHPVIHSVLFSLFRRSEFLRVCYDEVILKRTDNKKTKKEKRAKK